MKITVKSYFHMEASARGLFVRLKTSKNDNITQCSYRHVSKCGKQPLVFII